MAWQEIWRRLLRLNTKCVCRNWTRAIYCRFPRDVTAAMLVVNWAQSIHPKLPTDLTGKGGPPQRGSTIGVLKSRFPAFFSFKSRHPALFYARFPIPAPFFLRDCFAWLLKYTLNKTYLLTIVSFDGQGPQHHNKRP